MMDLNSKVKLRPASDSDIAFLSILYATTRSEELAQVAWSETEKHAFLAQQFDAQHQYYRQQFPNAAFDLIMSNDMPIGRLYVDRREDEIRLIDIALLPENRGQGIGSELITHVINEARSAAKAVRIHVEVNNPAMRLYRRLGFRQIDTNGIYYLLEWNDARQT